jgi:hypothetical protein
MADVSRMCTGRAFFHTKQDHIGLAPYGVRRNDIVCFLGQAIVPFILRPNQPFKQPGHAPAYHPWEGYIDEFMENCVLGIIHSKEDGGRSPSNEDVQSAEAFEAREDKLATKAQLPLTSI